MDCFLRGKVLEFLQFRGKRRVYPWNKQSNRYNRFFKRKDVVISAHRYGIDAMGAMAQGLFASLLIGTIIKTLGQQLGLAFLVTAGGYAAAVAGPAMAASIGYALHAPQLVLFSLIAVGGAANELGGAGGPLAVYLIAIIAAEVGKLVSKETKIDILVSPCRHNSGGRQPERAVWRRPSARWRPPWAASSCGPPSCSRF